ncbi:MAG: hypothetical protein KGQ60_13520 [Planctomycetes bacterium]|nr:hypothetical protein [Planctomycetota bacterium]
MLLEQNKFVVKSQSKAFSSSKSFEILDEAGKMLAMGKDVTPFFSSLLGSVTIEVRQTADNALVFSLVRRGWLFKKDLVLSSQGEVLGQYKSKVFSLSSGFHMYDKDGKHLGEIRGKMFKAEYQFISPDNKTEMGSVSRTWTGLAKSLFSGDDTHGVQIAPNFATDNQVKIMILGAAIAVESIFKKKGEKKSESSSGDDGE